MTGRIRVRVALTIDVDPDEWAVIYGTEPRNIRTDVKEYVLNHVQGATGIEESGATVRITK